MLEFISKHLNLIFDICIYGLLTIKCAYRNNNSIHFI